jgi:hypothetical protein
MVRERLALCHRLFSSCGRDRLLDVSDVLQHDQDYAVSANDGVLEGPSPPTPRSVTSSSRLRLSRAPGHGRIAVSEIVYRLLVEEYSPGLPARTTIPVLPHNAMIACIHPLLPC